MLLFMKVLSALFVIHNYHAWFLDMRFMINNALDFCARFFVALMRRARAGRAWSRGRRCESFIYHGKSHARSAFFLMTCIRQR